MGLPYASTVINVLQVSLRLVATSEYVPEDCPALQKYREAVEALVAELEKAAKLERPAELQPLEDALSQKLE